MNRSKHALAVAIATILTLAAHVAALAATESPIYSFAGKKKGSAPQWPLTVTPDGLYFGSTANGGPYEMGEIFQLLPPNAKFNYWRKDPVYDFATLPSPSTSDGYAPSGNLVPGPLGSYSYYGTTLLGGQSTSAYCSTSGVATKGCGTVFQLWPPGVDAYWTKDIIYSFNDTAQNSAQIPDGAGPTSLIEDSDGNLFGTTSSGTIPGAPLGSTYGTVFELSSALVGDELEWNLTTLYQFNSTVEGNGYSEGSLVNPGLLMDSNGVIYGTTLDGGNLGASCTPPTGKQGCGTVFTLTPPSSPGAGWTYAMIYVFGGGTIDGALPNGGLRGGPGTGTSPGTYLWGTTQGGGASGQGTIFVVGQEFLDQPYTDTVVYSFTGGADGGVPMAGLLESDDGSYWGTTVQGGSKGAGDCSFNGTCGVVFELQRVSDFTHFIYKFSTVAQFAGEPSDGANPVAPLSIDQNGSLYGTTLVGGAYGGGTVFQIPDVAPVYTVATPTISPKAGGYTTPQTVSIADTQTNAKIYYTTDGSHPTTSVQEYMGPFTVSSNTTVKAIAALPGYLTSAVGHAVYIIEPMLPQPSFSLKAGTYTGPQPLSITDTMVGVSIYYTTDGTEPTTASTLYTSTISISASETVKAIAVLNGYLQSDPKVAIYTIN
jgi:hypothetical protein